MVVCDNQQYLTRHPVLLDPLAASVHPKQRLGLEHATDFAVRSHDDQWTLVEIERPHDRLFTKKGDFLARFTHALRQVLDFQTWVDNNVAYAQRHMPAISSPRGLLVIGRSADLSEGEKVRLAALNERLYRVRIETFDGLLRRSALMYENLMTLPTLGAPTQVKGP